MPCRPKNPPTGPARFVLDGPNPGLIKRGTIDIWRRPFAKNPLHPEASGSTVFSASWTLEDEGVVILVSRVVPLTATTAPGFTGRVIGARQALDRALKENRHLGIFEDIGSAERYSNRLHQQQARIYRCR